MSDMWQFTKSTSELRECLERLPHLPACLQTSLQVTLPILRVVRLLWSLRNLFIYIEPHINDKTLVIYVNMHLPYHTHRSYTSSELNVNNILTLSFLFLSFQFQSLFEKWSDDVWLSILEVLSIKGLQKTKETNATEPTLAIRSLQKDVKFLVNTAL